MRYARCSLFFLFLVSSWRLFFFFFVIFTNSKWLSRKRMCYPSKCFSKCQVGFINRRSPVRCIDFNLRPLIERNEKHPNMRIFIIFALIVALLSCVSCHPGGGLGDLLVSKDMDYSFWVLFLITHDCRIKIQWSMLYLLLFENRSI